VAGETIDDEEVPGAGCRVPGAGCRVPGYYLSIITIEPSHQSNIICWSNKQIVRDRYEGKFLTVRKMVLRPNDVWLL
jgi:hypothetical protein